MRNLIQNEDLKRLFQGVSGAAAAGLLLGAAMYPDLDEDAVEGPQILMGRSGERAEPASPEVGLAAYGGRIPDYVIGTDWLKRRDDADTQVLAYEDRRAEQGDLMAYEAAEEEPLPQPQVARWEDEPREPPLYPSQRGNTYYGSDLPPPPELPLYEDQVLDPA